MITKLIKYCPNCKNKVAVVKGGKPNKQRYKCTVCKKRFVDRKYGIEIRAMAAIFSKCGYSLRETSKVFGVSPNTVRNWCIENKAYIIPDNGLIEILRKYKTLCENLNYILKTLEELGKEILIADKYWKKKNEIEKLYKHKETLNCKKPNGLAQYMSDEMQIDTLHKELIKMKHPKDFLTVEKIEKQLLLVKDKYTKYNEKINRIESKTALARKQYNLEAIINVLEKITHKK